MQYVTFWIPLEYKVDFSVFCTDSTSIKSQNITDEVETSSNLLTLEIITNKNLKISYQENEFLLQLQSYDEYGYFTYTYKENIDEELLKIQIYHLFKEFFHIHKNHHDEEDALVEAYISNSFDIEKAKKYYIENYIVKFESYESILYEFLEDGKIEDNSFDIEELSNLKFYILKAKNEMNYAKFISQDNDEHEKMISYENNLNNLCEQLSIFESKKIINSNNKINKWQFFLSLLGISLGILGFYYGYNGATSQSQNNVTAKIIENKSYIDSNFNSLNIKTVTLHKDIIVNQKTLKNIEKNCKKLQKLQIINNKKKEQHK